MKASWGLPAELLLTIHTLFIIHNTKGQLFFYFESQKTKYVQSHRRTIRRHMIYRSTNGSHLPKHHVKNNP